MKTKSKKERFKDDLDKIAKYDMPYIITYDVHLNEVIVVVKIGKNAYSVTLKGENAVMMKGYLYIMLYALYRIMK